MSFQQGGGSPKDDLLHRPYFIKKRQQRGGGGSKIVDFEKTLVLEDVVYGRAPMVALFNWLFPSFVDESSTTKEAIKNTQRLPDI